MFAGKSAEGAKNNGGGGGHTFFQGNSDVLIRLIRAPGGVDRFKVPMATASFEVVAVKRGEQISTGAHRAYMYKTSGGDYQDSDDQKWFSFVASLFNIRLGDLAETLTDIGEDPTKYDLVSKRGKATAQDEIDKALIELAESLTDKEGDAHAGRYVFLNTRVKPPSSYTKLYFSQVPPGTQIGGANGGKVTGLDPKFIDFLKSDGWTFDGSGSPFVAHAHDDKDDDKSDS
jgi:hypothetical protein